VLGEFAVQPAVVEPVDVGERLELDVVETAPGPAAVDELPLIEPVERLRERVDAPIDVKWVSRRWRELGHDELGAGSRL
jgi:hypothetical protein